MPTTSPTTEPLCLERGVPLSRSIIWDLQRRYFVREGAAAFRPGHVPSYVTNNPVWARTAAELTAAYLSDLVRHDPAIDRAAPFYVLELGAGAGRFGYTFVGQLERALAQSGLGDLDVVYVLTDFAASTRAFWREHPGLAPLIAAGKVDVAGFDAGRTTSIRLERSGVVIGPKSGVNPLVVIGNYLFDSLPQDVFSIEGGALREHVATTTTHLADLDHPDALAACRLALTPRLARLPYYGDAALDGLLARYRDDLEGVTFSLPSAGLRLIDQLAALAGGRMLLLTADKGYLDVDDMAAHGAEAMAHHGSFSMMVNFDAMARAVEARGGTALLPRHAQGGIAFLGFALGGPAPETRRTFIDHVERFGPADFIRLRKGLRRGISGWALPEILAFWRLAEWDWTLLLHHSDAVLDAIPGADAEDRAALRDAVVRAWNQYFPVHRSDDIAFQAGLVMAELGAHREALALFDAALAMLGPSAAIAYDRALCLSLLGQDEPARAAVAEALRLDPRHAGAISLATHLDARVATEVAA